MVIPCPHCGSRELRLSVTLPALFYVEVGEQLPHGVCPFVVKTKHIAESELHISTLTCCQCEHSWELGER